jgi:hypothetical protein
VQAVSKALAAMNSLIVAQPAPSVESLQKAVLVASTLLSNSVSQLASGALSLEAFSQAASPAALQQGLEAAVLAGTLPDLPGNLGDAGPSPQPLPADESSPKKQASLLGHR